MARAVGPTTARRSKAIRRGPEMTADPPPVYFEDVGQLRSFRRSEGNRSRDEGIAAVAFIPIVDGGRLAGKFMAYYDRPHRFCGPEIDVALTLSRGSSALASRGLRAEQARQAAERGAQQLRFDRRILRRCDRQQESRRHHPDLECRRRAAVRLYRRARSIGQPVTMLFPPGREDEEPTILARIRRGERIHHYETVRRRKDGSLLDISLTVSPVRDGSGRIVGASKIARDITDRKEAERKLQRERTASAGTARGHPGRDLHHRRRGQHHLLQPGGGRTCRPHAQCSAATNGA